MGTEEKTEGGHSCPPLERHGGGQECPPSVNSCSGAVPCEASCRRSMEAGSSEALFNLKSVPIRVIRGQFLIGAGGAFSFILP